MHGKTLLSLFALCATAAAASSACRCAQYEFLAMPRLNTSQPAPQQGCASYQLIDARGTLEPQGPSLMFQLAIQRILANTTNTTSHSVIYPAALDQNVTSGSAYLTHLIQSGVQRCPDQKYLLFGYSQGATLVLQALEQLSAGTTEAVASVILVGNPFRVPGRRSNTSREGQYDNRTAYGRFAAAKSKGSIPILSDTLDRSGRAKDVCLDVNTSEALEKHS